MLPVKQIHSISWWSWASAGEGSGVQEVSGEVRTSASSPWWGHLARTVQGYLLPLIFEALPPSGFQGSGRPQHSQISCLSTLTQVASANLGAFTRIAEIPFKSSSPDPSSPIPLLPLRLWKQAPCVPRIHCSVGLSPQDSTIAFSGCKSPFPPG